jgi:cell division septation protein DedD
MKRHFFTYFLLLFLLPLLLTGCKKKKSPPPPQKKVTAPAKTTPAAPAPRTRYYVITGSFLYPENVQRYEGMMRNEGFTPMQLPGDSGFQRVAVFSFDNEAEARQKLHEVRTSSSRFSDAWLLITKA